MNHSDTVILACSALEIYVSAAQEKEGTHYPVVFLDKENHMEPKQMKQCILAAEKALPQTVENVLVAMGFCGGALDYVQGSNQTLEKLVGGRWDRQFLVAEPGHLIWHTDFFE